MSEQLASPFAVKKMKHVVALRRSRFDGSEGNRPYVGLEDISPWTGTLIHDFSANPNVAETSLSTAFEPGDVLFGKLRPYLAKVWVADFLGRSTTECLVLKPVEVEPRFLGYVCRTDEFIRTVDASTYGSKMPRAEWDFIGNMPIPAPKRHEQRAIADYLDRETAQLNALIAAKQRVLELLVEKREALIAQAVTRGILPAGGERCGLEGSEEGDRAFAAGGNQATSAPCGRASDGWPHVRLKYICRFVGGGTPDRGEPLYWGGDIPWVSPKDMKRSTICDSEDRITTEGLDSSAATIIEPGAVLIVVRSGILKHSIPVAVNSISVTLNQDMVAIMPEKRLDSRYLARYIEGHQSELLSAWRKEGTTVESLERSLLEEATIPAPPLPQQRSIADYLDRTTAHLEELTTEVENAMTLLKERRAALIASAVTGRIVV